MMNSSILVLTDFLPAAQKALRYAVVLAQHLGLEVVALHALEMPKNCSKEVYKRMQTLRWESAQLEFRKIKNTYEGYEYQQNGQALKLHTETAVSPVLESVWEAMQAYEPSMIVLGADYKRPLKHFLFGKLTRELMEQSELPVMVVPVEAETTLPRHIVCATDLERNEQDGDLLLLTELFERFRERGAAIEHFQLAAPLAGKERMVVGAVEPYHLLPEQEEPPLLSFVEDLDVYLSDNPTDMLVMLTRGYPVWEPCPAPKRKCKNAHYAQTPLLALKYKPGTKP